MKFNSLPACPPNRNKVGCFTAQLSPDGWIDSMYENAKSAHLTSEEVLECSQFINSFINELKTQDIFRKYVKKNGGQIDSVSSVMFYAGNLLNYVATASGYSVAIETYRKENA